jgi:hypothetical protein
VLLNGLLPVEPLWSSLLLPLQRLTDYAVDFRYPGHSAQKPHARQSMKDTKAVRKEVRSALGLPP